MPTNKLWTAVSVLSGNLVRMRGPASGSSVYLTFDDGPHPQHTAPLLDLLAQHNAKGSFFMTGTGVEQQPHLVQRVLSEGHAIGNHSMTHPKMRTLRARSQWAEIDRADVVLQGLDGRRRHPFRPPNGRLTAATLAACLWRRQPLVLWTIDSHDFKLEPAEVVKRLQVNAPVPGDVILFHDDSDCAGQALEVLLPAWKRAGLCFPALK